MVLTYESLDKTLKYNYSQTEPPLTANSPQGPFFVEQSIHSLLFQLLYNGHLFIKWLLSSSVAKVPVVERFNCMQLKLLNIGCILS